MTVVRHFVCIPGIFESLTYTGSVNDK
jgi:hypothetical protein